MYTESEQYVPLHQLTFMTEDLSTNCILASPCVKHGDAAKSRSCRTMRRGTTDRGPFADRAEAHTVGSEGETLQYVVRSHRTTSREAIG